MIHCETDSAESDEDRAFSDYTREMRDMVREERARIDDAVKALFTLEGLLFFAISFAWDKGLSLPFAISILGLVSTCLIAWQVCEMSSAIHSLQKTWNERSMDVPAYRGPAIISSRPNASRAIVASFIFPSTFAVAWGCILGLLIRTQIFGLPLRESILNNMP